MAKTKAQHKADQRARDKIILASIGFSSLEGVMSVIRKMDDAQKKQLKIILESNKSLESYLNQTNG